MRRVLTIIFLGVVVLFTSVLFGQVLGGFYIYNLVVEDNPSIVDNKKINTQAPAPPKRKVLRLDPIEFYTIQAGTFQEKKSAQNSIDKLASFGLRPFVTSQSPYKIWVGCFSEMNSGRDLETALKNQGFEAFIGKGLINDRALKFPGDDKFMIDYFAPLLGKYDIILDHSMKMFQSPKISAYKPDIWKNMIEKVKSETVEGIMGIDELLQLPKSSAYRNDLIKLKDKAEAYSQGLNNIINSQKDKDVLSSQGQLLELIAAYHNLINQTNGKLD